MDEVKDRNTGLTCCRAKRSASRVSSSDPRRFLRSSCIRVIKSWVMAWTVDGDSKPGILRLQLVGRISVEEMREFVLAHDRAIDAFQGKNYRVFCDIRTLVPLSPECAELFQKAKAYSSAHRNFQGSAVWVDNALTALQHRRTSQGGGVIATEIFSENEIELWEHLRTVKRNG
jgi:hypothetical protein